MSQHLSPPICLLKNILISSSLLKSFYQIVEVTALYCVVDIIGKVFIVSAMLVVLIAMVAMEAPPVFFNAAIEEIFERLDHIITITIFIAIIIIFIFLVVVEIAKTCILKINE
mmetsp:Transcript_1031/g.1999  ORF Transcript_1031/g.1999 Transcript_1031/m.1999 type:complete len:113 (-) Transcript_1031:575-913(-)